MINTRLTQFIICCLLVCIVSCARIHYRTEKIPSISAQREHEIRTLYDACELEGRLRYDIFRIALAGYSHIKLKNPNVITIIDYSQPSTAKRCFVIDIVNQRVLFQVLVAHGKNTGENEAVSFSNVSGSLQSSLGFFRTAETYDGKHGYSMRLDGLEKGINHLARKRDIVIHGASYVSEDFIKQEGRLGRSWGCPAFPVGQTTAIIDAIKGGSCIYIHGNDPDYQAKSCYVAGE